MSCPSSDATRPHRSSRLRQRTEFQVRLLADLINARSFKSTRATGGKVVVVINVHDLVGPFNCKREFRRSLEHRGETLSELAENVIQFPEVFMVGAVQHFPLVNMAGPHDGHEGWSDEGVDVP